MTNEPLDPDHFLPRPDDWITNIYQGRLTDEQKSKIEAGEYRIDVPLGTPKRDADKLASWGYTGLYEVIKTDEQQQSSVH